MLGKLLRFSHMHENKIFIFLKEKINLKNLRLFFLNFQNFFRKVLEKTRYFNTRSVSYSINIQPDIVQNY
jgi:hypothetical protein